MSALRTSKKVDLDSVGGLSRLEACLIPAIDQAYQDHICCRMGFALRVCQCDQTVSLAVPMSLLPCSTFSVMIITVWNLELGIILPNNISK